jgi:hypothetical protein
VPLLLAGRAPDDPVPATFRWIGERTSHLALALTDKCIAIAKGVLAVILRKLGSRKRDWAHATNETVEWTSFARRLLRAGHDIFATSNVQVTEKGYGDEKYLALTLLARTISNLRGALLWALAPA